MMIYKSMSLSAVALLLTCAGLGCSSSSDENPPASGGQDASVDAPTQQEAATPEAAQGDSQALPACPEETELGAASLPCDCYGTTVTDPQAAFPTCTTKVVCCPGAEGLRCEEEETDGGPTADAAPADASGDASAPKCRNEIDLSTASLPCDCYGTIVNDVHEAMPSCTQTVVCCPGAHGLKCE